MKSDHDVKHEDASSSGRGVRKRTRRAPLPKKAVVDSLGFVFDYPIVDKSASSARSDTVEKSVGVCDDTNFEKFQIDSHQGHLDLKITRAQWLKGLGLFVTTVGIKELCLTWHVPKMLLSSEEVVYRLLEELAEIETPLTLFSLKMDGCNLHDLFCAGDRSPEASKAFTAWHTFLKQQHHHMKSFTLHMKGYIDESEETGFMEDLINHLPTSIEYLDVAGSNINSDAFLSILMYRIATSRYMCSLNLNCRLDPSRLFTLTDLLITLGPFGYVADIKLPDLRKIEQVYTPPATNDISINSEFFACVQEDIEHDFHIISDESMTLSLFNLGRKFGNAFTRILLADENSQISVAKRPRKAATRFSHERIRLAAIGRGEALDVDETGESMCRKALRELLTPSVADKVFSQRYSNNEVLTKFLLNRICARMLKNMKVRVWWEPSNDTERDVHCARFWKAAVSRVRPEEETATVLYESLPSETVQFRYLQPLPKGSDNHTFIVDLKEPKSPIKATVDTLPSRSRTRVRLGGVSGVTNLGLSLKPEDGDQQQLNITPPPGTTEITVKFSSSDDLTEYTVLMCDNVDLKSELMKKEVVEEYRPLWCGEWVEFNWDDTNTNKFVGVVIAKCRHLDKYILAMPWHEDDNLIVLSAYDINPLTIISYNDWFRKITKNAKISILDQAGGRLVPEGLSDICDDAECPFVHRIPNRDVRKILINCVMLNSMCVFSASPKVSEMKIPIPFQFSNDIIQGIRENVVIDTDFFDEAPLSMAVLELSREVLQSYKQPKMPQDFRTMNYTTYCLARSLSVSGRRTYSPLLEYDMNVYVKKTLSWNAKESKFDDSVVFDFNEPLEIVNKDEGLNVNKWNSLIELHNADIAQSHLRCNCNKKKNQLLTPCNHLAILCAACQKQEETRCPVCGVDIDSVIRIL